MFLLHEKHRTLRILKLKTCLRQSPSHCRHFLIIRDTEPEEKQRVKNLNQKQTILVNMDSSVATEHQEPNISFTRRRYDVTIDSCSRQTKQQRLNLIGLFKSSYPISTFVCWLLIVGALLSRIKQWRPLEQVS